MEDLYGKFLEAREELAQRIEDYKERYGPFLFIGLLILSAIFGWD
ncbi:MAG: hypothetical protein ACU0C8_13610 [Roseovarius sp.]